MSGRGKKPFFLWEFWAQRPGLRDLCCRQQAVEEGLVLVDLELVDCLAL